MAYVVGLDIGSTKVCCLAIELTASGSLRVVGHGIAPCKGVRRGTVEDIDETVRAVRVAKEAAETMAGFAIDSAYVGVTGEHILSTNSKGAIAISNVTREITEGDKNRAMQTAKQVVLPPDREILHAIPRHYTVDGHKGVANPVNMAASRLEIEAHIVTAGSAFLRNARRCAERAGIAPAELVLEPLAASMAVLTPEEKEAGVALIDIGGGTADVAVFHDGSIFGTGVVPVGAHHVTKDIYMMFRTASIEEAERLKLQSGCALIDLVGEDEVASYEEMSSNAKRSIPKKLLTEVIQARMEEILELARDEIRKSVRNGAPAGGIVLTGGGSLLKGTVELARKVMNDLPVRASGPSVALDGYGDRARHPGLSTAVGLALYGASKLRPEEAVVEVRDGALAKMWSKAASAFKGWKED